MVLAEYGCKKLHHHGRILLTVRLLIIVALSNYLEKAHGLLSHTLIVLDNVLNSSCHFFVRMVDPRIHRFYYHYLPSTNDRQHCRMPIRDLAAAWDATKVIASGMLDGQQEDVWTIQTTIVRTLQSYQMIDYDKNNVNEAPRLILDPEILQEPSTIAHSAISILAHVNAIRCGILDPSESQTNVIDALVGGILSSQQDTGGFATEFGTKDVHCSIEFAAGQAMLALLEAYDDAGFGRDSILSPSTRAAILPSIEHAVMFYCDHYYNHVEDDLSVNYNIWQLQAMAHFHHILHREGRDDQARLLTTYIFQLTKDILNSHAWKYHLAWGQSFYGNLHTLEIVCGLDALADSIQVARTSQSAVDGTNNDLEWYLQNAAKAIDFLEWQQSCVPKDSIGYGGFGFGGSTVLEQRLDVTGHVISALSKLHTMRKATCDERA